MRQRTPGWLPGPIELAYLRLHYFRRSLQRTAVCDPARWPRVVGWEKMTVPAGTFDAVLIKRTIFVADGDPTRTGTQFLESDWYVPSVGRVVRAESSSGYDDLYQPHGRMWIRGDWTVLELTGPAASPLVVGRFGTP